MNTKTAIANQRGNGGITDHCLSCPNLCKPQFENTNSRRETNTYKRRIRESLEMERLGQLSVGSKDMEKVSIWNRVFLNKVWEKKKRENICTSVIKILSPHQPSPSDDANCLHDLFWRPQDIAQIFIQSPFFLYVLKKRGGSLLKRDLYCVIICCDCTGSFSCISTYW